MVEEKCCMCGKLAEYRSTKTEEPLCESCMSIDKSILKERK